MARHSITVNTVCPGVVETPPHDRLMAHMIGRGWTQFDGGRWEVDEQPDAPAVRKPSRMSPKWSLAFLASDLGRNMTAAAYYRPHAAIGAPALR